MTTNEAENDRLQRYRDAHCEDEYEYLDLHLEEDGRWFAGMLGLGAIIAALTWFLVGSIMAAGLR